MSNQILSIVQGMIAKTTTLTTKTTNLTSKDKLSETQSVQWPNKEHSQKNNTRRLPITKKKTQSPDLTPTNSQLNCMTQTTLSRSSVRVRMAAYLCAKMLITTQIGSWGKRFTMKMSPVMTLRMHTLSKSSLLFTKMSCTLTLNNWFRPFSWPRTRVHSQMIFSWISWKTIYINKIGTLQIIMVANGRTTSASLDTFKTIIWNKTRC